MQVKQHLTIGSNDIRLTGMNETMPTHAAALWRAAEMLGGQAGIAKKLGYADRRNVSPWFAEGARYLPPQHCVTIERETFQAVRRWDLRPDDWHRIWPELVGAEGAPPAPETSVQGEV